MTKEKTRIFFFFSYAPNQIVSLMLPGLDSAQDLMG